MLSYYIEIILLSHCPLKISKDRERERERERKRERERERERERIKERPSKYIVSIIEAFNRVTFFSLRDYFLPLQPKKKR